MSMFNLIVDDTMNAYARADDGEHAKRIWVELKDGKTIVHVEEIAVSP